MKYLTRIIIIFITVFIVVSFSQKKKSEPKKIKPNILFILAEDISTEKQ